VEVLADRLLVEGEPTLRHVIVAAHSASGENASYQLFLGVREAMPDRLTHAVIGALDSGGIAYDAIHDHEVTDLLLQWLADDADVAGIAFRHHQPDELERDLHGLALSAEQSNTSVAYGEEYMFKLIRNLVPGLNPDLEITRALTDAGSQHVPQIRGWIETDLDGETTTLATLHEYLTSGTDGFVLATTSVRDLFAEGDLHADEVGGDFAAEAERLGSATAEVHLALAEVLPTSTAGPTHFADVASGMRRRLEEISEISPELAAMADDARAVFDRLGEFSEPVRLQRIHGDYHLAQALRVDSGWVLIDFEGEPGTPVAERTRLASPLRDVAGMLRSFSYAAYYLLADVPTQPQLEYRANEWAERNCDAFCTGYGKVSGRDPREDALLLRAFQLDKAIYEVGYEKRHRPGWVTIPLRGVERLLS
jgi:maltokinase